MVKTVSRVVWGVMWLFCLSQWDDFNNKAATAAWIALTVVLFLDLFLNHDGVQNDEPDE